MTAPTTAEWAEAAWALQSWVRSCFDVMGVCTFCGHADPAADGTGDRAAHINNCPWPQMRALLDRDLAAGHV